MGTRRHKKKFFARNGKRITRREREIMKFKDKADKERQRYKKNPDPGKPIMLDDPRNPYYGQGQKTSDEDTRRGIFGFRKMNPINTLAARGIKGRKRKRQGLSPQRLKGEVV